MRHVLLASSLTAVVVTLLPPPAEAGFSTFTDRTAFESAFGGALQNESFENAPLEGSQIGPRTLSFTDFDVTYDGDDIFRVTDRVVFTFGPTDGAQYLQVGLRPEEAWTVTFDFDSPQSVFGFDIKGLQQLDLAFAASNGATGTAASAGIGGSVQFFGIIDDAPFTSISFISLVNIDSPAQDIVSLDHVSLAAPAVPEPSSLALLALGSVGLAGYARRRKSRAAVP